jgi:hypothetical protein
MSGPYALDKDYSPDDSLYHDEQSGLGVPGGAGLIKGPWAPAEDILLSSLVAKLGAKAWSAVASHMALHGHYRLGKQCRERYVENPHKSPWSLGSLNRSLVARYPTASNQHIMSTPPLNL